MDSTFTKIDSMIWLIMGIRAIDVVKFHELELPNDS